MGTFWGWEIGDLDVTFDGNVLGGADGEFLLIADREYSGDKWGIFDCDAL